MVRWSALFWVGVSLFAAGCASNGPTSTYTELGQDANTTGFGRQYPEDPNENAFTFGVGDEVGLAVRDDDTLTGSFLIRQDGMITLPLLNDVKAAGLTTDQLRKKVEGRLAVFLKEPQVTVSVGKVVSKKYYVVGGDPKNGGDIIKDVPYVGDTTLLDAFIQMGSPSNLLFDDCHVKVIKGDPRNPRVLTINVREIYSEGRTGGNVQIRPNDIIYVPPTFVGRLNALITGFALPFQSLFLISRTIVELDYSVRIIQGDEMSRGRVF